MTPRLADYLDRSRERLEQRIADHQQTLRRIEAFTAEHRDTRADSDSVCWVGDPRGGVSA